MGIKTIFSITCVLSSIIGSTYFAYNFGKNKISATYKAEISDYEQKIEKSQSDIEAILKNLPSEFYIMKGKAEEALGGGA